MLESDVATAASIVGETSEGRAATAMTGKPEVTSVEVRGVETEYSLHECPPRMVRGWLSGWQASVTGLPQTFPIPLVTSDTTLEATLTQY